MTPRKAHGAVPRASSARSQAKYASALTMLAATLTGSATTWAQSGGPLATSKIAIFMGGETAAFASSTRPPRSDLLGIEDVPADVGRPPDIPPEHRSLAMPFGVSRELHWTGRGRARYSLLGPSPLWNEPELAHKYDRNGFLVFNLRLLAGRGGLRLGVICRGPEQREHCRTSYRLEPSALASVGLWRTYHIPLSEIDPSLFDEPPHRGDRIGFVVENAGSVPLSVAFADVRFEAYPAGWSFARSLSQDLLSGLSLHDKIGQMSQLVNRADSSADPVQPEEAAAIGLGSLFGASSAHPQDADGTPLADTPEVWVEFLRTYQRAALATEKAIPILFGMDAVHGLALVPGATIFPHNIGLGAAGDSTLARSVAHATAVEAAALGFKLTFSPTLAVARDERWGRTYESASELPSIVAEIGAALTSGYQGTTSRDLGPLLEPESILACAKHFGGDGASDFEAPEYCLDHPCDLHSSIDRGNSRLSEADLIALHLAPYARAIESGLGMIMSSDSRWQEQIGTGNPHLLTEILRYELGFEGVLVTDYHSWAGLDADPIRGMLQAINAGNDLIMLAEQPDQLVLEQAVTMGIEDGSLTLARVDQAVRRILEKKFELGLFDIPFAQPALFSRVGSVEHHALARKAVQKSLVLLQNDARGAPGEPVLPLRRRAKVYVAGKSANDIGMQSGGWTDTWQGVLGNALPGTTVLSGIQELSSGEVLYSPDASADPSGFDVGVVVIGEYPYAEFCGDVLGKTPFCEFVRPRPPSLVRERADVPFPIGLPPPQSLGLGTVSFEYFTPEIPGLPLPVTLDPVSDLEVTRRVCAELPCVVVLMTGRPLFIEEALDAADAFVVAWLPGAEGAGVADVLYARRGLDFTGKLAHTWPTTPRDAADPTRPSAQPELDYVPQNEFVNGDGNLDATLFPVGYGLSYRR